MTRTSLLIAAVAVAALTTSAHAAVLFTRTLTVSSSVNNFDNDQLDVDLVFADDQLNPTNLIRLFDDLVISPASLNQEFIKTPSDPGFDEVVARLTDASQEFIRIFLTEDEPGGVSEKRGWSESDFFLHGTPANAPDLVNSTIESISLRVDQFTLAPSGPTAPLSVGDPLNVQLFFTINGTSIPEPTAIWLLGCGIATLSLLLFTRRRPQLAKATLPLRKR